MDKHLIIRGKRINDQLEESKLMFERSTVDNLNQNIAGFVPTTTKRQHAHQNVNIESIMSLPFVGTKTLNIEATARSGTEPAKQAYKTLIIFNQVEFENEKTDTNIEFTAKNKQIYYMQPIVLSEHTVRVNCTCLDFFYRFKSYNAKDQSLAGRAPPAYQKVPGSTRGPSNIKRVPGLCKHLLQTIEALKDAKMIT